MSELRESCKDCEKRSFDCHVNCEIYKRFKADREAVNRVKRNESIYFEKRRKRRKKRS